MLPNIFLRGGIRVKSVVEHAIEVKERSGTS